MLWVSAQGGPDCCCGKPCSAHLEPNCVELFLTEKSATRPGFINAIFEIFQCFRVTCLFKQCLITIFILKPNQSLGLIYSIFNSSWSWSTNVKKSRIQGVVTKHGLMDHGGISGGAAAWNEAWAPDVSPKACLHWNTLNETFERCARTLQANADGFQNGRNNELDSRRTLKIEMLESLVVVTPPPPPFTPLSCRNFPLQQPMQYLLTVCKCLMASGIQFHLTLNLFVFVAVFYWFCFRVIQSVKYKKYHQEISHQALN